jgi:hypothetical protein
LDDLASMSNDAFDRRVDVIHHDVNESSRRRRRSSRDPASAHLPDTVIEPSRAVPSLLIPQPKTFS